MEDIWTTYTIGGEIKTADALGELLDFFDDFSGLDKPDRARIMDAVTSKTSLVIAGDLAWGNHEDLDAFLVEQGMAFSAAYGSGDEFGAGLRFWAPGMKDVGTREADEDGNPTVNLKTLQQAKTEGRTIEDVIAYLDVAASVPPLTAALGAFEDVDRRSVADRMGYPNALKAVQVKMGETVQEIALVPQRRGYFVAVHVNCDPDRPEAGTSSREDFKDVVLAAAAFDAALKEAKGEIVAEEAAGA